MTGCETRSIRIVTSVVLYSIVGCNSTNRNVISDVALVPSHHEAQEGSAAPRGAATAFNGSNPMGRATSFLSNSGPCLPPPTESGCTVGNAFDDKIANLIRTQWGGDGEGALRVARCESGQGGTTASNGEYLGLFQMGNNERARFGHGLCAEQQISAAYAYYRQSGGWGPWACKPL